MNQQMSIAHTASVGRAARLGTGVIVGPNCVIEDHAEIGDGCVLGPNVVVFGVAKLGAGCRVHAGAVLGDLPQDFHATGEPSYVEIGAETTIRENVTIHRASKPGNVTRVGRRCQLMAGCHVGHDVVIGDDVILVNNVLLGGHSQVGDRAVLGGGAMVHQFARIGRLAMLSGGSGAQMDVPPFCMTRSITCSRIMSLNVVGLRRAGFTPEERHKLQHAFHVLYRSGLPTKQALAVLDSEPSPHIREIVDFVRASKRGICRSVIEDSPKAATTPPRLRLVG
jgi:UDP-N-acetylglucosamine acyltransferase